MKQRLAIASAILNDPEVLVLDEPTNGLDPQGIAEIRELIREIAKSGKTIIIASHQLDEIEKVCTDVVILKLGNLIRQSKIGEILETSHQVIVSANDSEKLEELINEIDGITLNSKEDKKFVLDVEENINTEFLNRSFFEKGLVLTEFRETRKSLESQFLEIIKE